MTSMPWIKSYTRKLDDIRIARSSEGAQLAYFKLELLAGKCDAEGSFFMNGEQLTDEEIAFIIRMDAKDLRKAIKELTANKLIHMNGKGAQLTDFANEQVSQDVRREAWRERQQRHRDVTSDEETVTRDSSVTHAPRTRVQNKNQNQNKNQKRKDLPTPTPSSRKASPSGRQAGDRSKSDPDTSNASRTTLNAKQQKRAEHAERILRSSGLRDPKLKYTSVILATRNYKTTKDLTRYILAALASSFSDPKVNSPEVVAAWRMEQDQVPQRYEDPKLWGSIPAKTLEAAGISNIDRYTDKLSKLRRRDNSEGNDN